jgi:hypothetical protein
VLLFVWVVMEPVGPQGFCLLRADHTIAHRFDSSRLPNFKSRIFKSRIFGPQIDLMLGARLIFSPPGTALTFPWPQGTATAFKKMIMGAIIKT